MRMLPLCGHMHPARAARPAGTAWASPRARPVLLLVLAVMLMLSNPAFGAAKPKKGTCQVVIRPTAKGPPANTVLNLAEVQLFDAAGRQIDASLLSFSLSSTMVMQGVPLAAGFCNDGATSSVVSLAGDAPNTGAGQLCHSKPVPEDPKPRLTAAYPCAAGLSKVVVHNRAGQEGGSIDAFSLDVVASKGAVTQTYAFTGGATTRSFTIVKACGPGLKVDSPECNQCLPGFGGKRCKPCTGKGKWSPGGSLKPCRKCPKYAPTQNADRSSCECLDPQLEFTGYDCADRCTDGLVRDTTNGDCACAPGVVKGSIDCSQCMPGHGGKTCQPCASDKNDKWSPGGSLEECRTCPSDAFANADKSSCVCSAPALDFTGTECRCRDNLFYNPFTARCTSDKCDVCSEGERCNCDPACNCLKLLPTEFCLPECKELPPIRGLCPADGSCYNQGPLDCGSPSLCGPALGKRCVSFAECGDICAKAGKACITSTALEDFGLCGKVKVITYYSTNHTDGNFECIAGSQAGANRGNRKGW
ncbi:MAG: hypothetical protein J3K34DRAFT_403891 [Monoraphidium minutum]|nr:MAG: hypothetical protein J3K34DRAFT_403891 [Monoraphidium minutum]